MNGQDTLKTFLTKDFFHEYGILPHLKTFYKSVVDMNAETVVELGVETGQSTIAFLCGCIDVPHSHLWSVDIRSWEDNDIQLTKSNILKLGLNNLWTYLSGSDLDIVKTWTKEIDILFIDTSHFYDHTLQELKLWSPFVRKGGKIFMHDIWFTDGKGNKGEVNRAIHDFLTEYPEEFTYIALLPEDQDPYGMGLLERI